MGISLTGLASGLDTAAMIEQLMKLERQPYVKMEKQKEVIGYQKDIMRAMNTKLDALKTAASELSLAAGFNISGTTSSNKDIVGVTASDNAAKGVYNVEVTSVATNHVVKSNSISVAGNDLTGNHTFTIIHGDKELKVNIDTTAHDTNDTVLNKIVSEINGNSSIGITASVVETTPGNKTLTFTTTDTGTANAITTGSAKDGTKVVLNDETGLLSKLKIIDGSGNNVQDANTVQDAVLNVNGINITRSTNEIKDVIPGIILTLNDKGKSTITVQQDTEKISSKIEAFVNAYNDVAGTIRDSIKKDGAMQGDSLLKNIDSTLYNLFSARVNTSNSGISMMSQIGLEIDKGITDPKLMTGKITLDKDKLLAKLKEDPQAVTELFGKDDSTSGTPASGIAFNLNNMINNWTNSADGLLTSSIKGYDSQLSAIDERMEVLSQRLVRKEKALQAQFAAMEVALSGLKSEQNWLAGQFNQLTANAKAK